MDTKEDIKWLAEKFEAKSRWLFYGEFEGYLNDFLKTIFRKELSFYGFGEDFTNDFQVAYWSVLSELVALDFAEYGTSPRGAWLTADGERFKKMILESENALAEVEDFIHRKYN